VKLVIIHRAATL